MRVEIDFNREDAKEFSAWLLRVSERAKFPLAFTARDKPERVAVDARFRLMLFKLSRQMTRQLVPPKPVRFNDGLIETVRSRSGGRGWPDRPAMKKLNRLREKGERV